MLMCGEHGEKSVRGRYRNRSIRYRREYGTVRNTCATHANCHDEHAVVLDDGRIVYVELRARDRYWWVRRPEEHVWQQRFEAAVYREFEEHTIAASCASESTTEEEADEVMVEIDSDGSNP